MTTTKWLRRASLPGLVALAAIVSAGPASASSLSADPAVYAIESVVTSGGAITLPPGVLVYTTGANLLTTVLGGNFVVTFTLPAGVTPTGTVTASVANVGVGSTCAPQSTLSPSSVSGSTITFTVPTNPAILGNVCTVTLQGSGPGVGLSVTGATALQAFNPGLTVITYSARLTANNVVSFPIDAGPVTATFASSFSGLFFLSLAPASAGAAPLVIDVGAAGLGKKFKQFGADSVVADLGDLIVLGIVGLVQQDGVSPFTIGVGQITITLTGNFNNIASAFITGFAGGPSTSGPCGSSGTPPGTPAAVATGAAVTPTSITFTGISLGVPLGVNIFGELCLVANGTGVIGPNPPAAVETVTATVSSTPPTTQKDPGAALLAYTYNGSIQQLLYTDANPIYPNFIRIVNNSSAPASVIPVLQPEGGSPVSGAPIAVPGNNNVLIPFATIATSAGLTLGPGNFRTSALFLTPGFACINNATGPICPVSVSNLIGEPSGNVNMMGSGAAP
jgi:hypothetical protein